MKTVAIVLAAGQGSRMNSDIPKQYMEINGKPVLYYTLKAFEESEITSVILVTGAKEQEYCKENIVEQYGFSKVEKIIAGGAERYLSVACGLREMENAGYVLIHDGARAFITKEIINRTIEMVAAYGAVAVGVPAKDTIKKVNEDACVIETPPRQYMWQVQTPQAFPAEDIRIAYETVIAQKAVGLTDDCMVWERVMDTPVKMIEGSYENMKITTPEDIYIGEVILRHRQ